MVDDFKIRPFTPDEWSALRSIRLKALQGHPGYFASHYEKTAQISEAEWRNRISEPSSCIFGLFTKDLLIGITGIYVPDDQPEHAILIMSYIEPEYRGRGLAKLFYEARLDWALAQDGLSKIIVSHREDNDRSKSAIIANGFKCIDDEEILWPDGTLKREVKYELDLEKLRK